tara:strand:+ start:810 stop:1436 length:627 start_codon:yes stop_codon:yes gene_type:complete
MLNVLKNYFYIIFIVFFTININSEDNPYQFIDSNAQIMVKTLKLNSNLFEENRFLYEEKIKIIFEPMIDFRRVAASVMGKKYYLISTKNERSEFENIFKDSLLNTYAETLAQWGDSTITTEFPKNMIKEYGKNVEVKQILDTGNSKYPIIYKLRKTNNEWKIINIIINGVNLGLTFRNQFSALADANNEDIQAILKNWVSDAGDAGIK